MYALVFAFWDNPLGLCTSKRLVVVYLVSGTSKYLIHQVH